MLHLCQKLFRNVVLVLIIGGLNIAKAANYESGAYMRVDVGASMFSNKNVDKIAGIFPLSDIALGYRHEMFRLELNGQYKQKSYDASLGIIKGSLKLEQISGFLNCLLYTSPSPRD